MYPLDQAKVAAYQGTCLARLGRPAQALPALRQALARVGTAPSKQRALLGCDLAGCLLQAGEAEEAARWMVEAWAIGRRWGSQRVLARAHALRSALGRVGARSLVAAMDEQLAAGRPCLS